MNTIFTQDHKRKYKLAFKISKNEVLCYVFKKIDKLPKEETAVTYKWVVEKSFLGKEEIDLVHPMEPVYVEKIPGEKGYFQFLGFTGLSEKIHNYQYKDCSYYELVLCEGRLGPWRNRYFFEPGTNISSDKSRYIWRANYNEVKLVSVLIPFLENDMSKYPIEIVAAYEPTFIGSSRKITQKFDFLKDYGKVQMVRDYFWKVEGKSKIKVAPNATTSIPVHLVWNRDGKPCGNKAIELKVTSSSGYVPVLDIQFNKGEATIQFHALGLPSGLQTNLEFFVHDRVKVGTVPIQIS